jgi:hypothetical protein
VAADLLIVKVGDGGAVLDAPHTVDRAAGESKRLRQRGFARTAMAEQDDVTQLLGVIFFHRYDPLY